MTVGLGSHSILVESSFGGLMTCGLLAKSLEKSSQGEHKSPKNGCRAEVATTNLGEKKMTQL